MKKTILLVNFGGPRSLQEVEPFLISLLTDQEMIQTKLPAWLHRFLFTRIARKRALAMQKEYALLGGKSPIYDTTEKLAQILRDKGFSVLTFHRYLPSTHEAFWQRVRELPDKEALVFPLFPQFSYTTTGSIAALFSKHLPQNTLQKLRWVRSYPLHSGFIQSWRSLLSSLLTAHQLHEDEICLFFSAHGLPKRYVEEGDPYQTECLQSTQALVAHFPKAQVILAYQSQFGKEEWLRPYTREVCRDILNYTNRSTVIFIPIAFTSDHLETLFEIERQYIPSIQAKGIKALRLEALNLHPLWSEGILAILEEHLANSSWTKHQDLLRYTERD